MPSGVCCIASPDVAIGSEIQATAEKTAFTEVHFLELLTLARNGTGTLFQLQRRALDV